jgi:type I restriction enzyme S subunit
VSLLDWAAELPDQWEVKPLRSTADYVVSNVDKVPTENEIPVRLCNYTDVYNNEFITLALDFMQATASEGEVAKFGLRVDDVIITKDSESWDDIGVPALVRETANDLVCGYHLALLRPHKQKMDGAFLFRCLQAKPVRVQLELAANGVTRFGIPKSEIGAMTLPVPPLPQQRAIADYLNRETARLDALVAVKERVLGLLAEKRRALITRAVTRGLDPRATLRESGISWLGEIPAHWTTNRLKFIAQISYGVGDELDKSLTSGVPLISLPNVDIEGSLHLAELGWANLSESEKFPLLLRKGDLLFNWRNGSSAHVGKTAYFDAEGEFTHVGFLLRIRFDLSRYEPRFFQALLQTLRATGYFLYTRAMVNNTFNQTELGNLSVSVPALNEQRAIVARIAAETAKLDAMRSATERTIALLKERRAALIAAAVTGQIDVQEAIA